MTATRIVLNLEARKTCSCLFYGVSYNYRATWCNMGIAQMCLCETKYQGGGIAPFWGSADLPEKVSFDMGYRSDGIAISPDMGPLSTHYARFPAITCLNREL